MTKATKCFLRLGDEFVAYDSVPKAKAAFALAATELYSYGQNLEGSIHIDKEKEYPDYLLNVGKFGGIRLERC
jgi:hypothetical protein